MGKHGKEFINGPEVYQGSTFRLSVYEKERILDAYGNVDTGVTLYDTQEDPELSAVLPPAKIALEAFTIPTGKESAPQLRSGIQTAITLPDAGLSRQAYINLVNYSVAGQFDGSEFIEHTMAGTSFYTLSNGDSPLGARFDNDRLLLWSIATGRNVPDWQDRNHRKLEAFFQVSLSVLEAFAKNNSGATTTGEITVAWPEPPTEVIPVLLPALMQGPGSIPSASQELMMPPSDPFEEIGGLTNAKRRVQEIAKVFKHRDLAEELDIKPTYFILYGPPGTGKTSLLQAFAHAAEADLQMVDSSEIIHSHIGQSAANLATVIKKAIDTSRTRRLVLAFDEIDSLFSASDNRIRDYSQLNNTAKKLLDMARDPQAGSRDLIIAGATNRQLSGIEPAIVQRFETIAAPAPNERELGDIWRKQIDSREYKKLRSAGDADLLTLRSVFDGQLDFARLVGMTWRSEEGMTGRDIDNIIGGAQRNKFMALVALRESGQPDDPELKQITQRDLEQAIIEYRER